MSRREAFGLILAGIGAGMSAIGLLTNSLGATLAITSSAFVLFGLLIWVSARFTKA